MIMREDEARRIGDLILKTSAADDILINIGNERSACARFSNNSIAHNVFAESASISITAAFGNQKGTVSTNIIDDESLKEAVKRAEAIAKLAPPDPEYLQPLGEQNYLPVEAYFDKTANLSPEDMANLSKAIIDPAQKAGFNASGTVETSESAQSVITNKGLFAYHKRTDAQIGCTITGQTSTGWARDVTVDIDLINPAKLANAAVEQALKSTNPIAMEPGKYTVILMPAAVGHLTEYLLWWANARTTQEGLTYLSDKLGQKLAGDNITVYSDPSDSRLPMCPFDYEGVPREKITWINKGVFDQLWWDRWTAQKSNVKPVPMAAAPIMLGTDKTAEELIASVERGILVTHFWYIRSVKDDETLVTGMTRDGTFLVEDGKVKCGVKNMRFNETCLGMLQRMTAIGKPGSCADVELMPSLIPPAIVSDWNFVGVTDF